MTVHEFVAKWRLVELKERSAAQEHFLDLCNLFGHPTPAAADPTGNSYCFEKGAAKHGGGDGFADVWKRTETLEFPGTGGGPWDRYIVSGSAHPLPIPDSRLPTSVLVGTVRYPRLVPRDAACAARLKNRTLTKLYNERPAWLADCHAKLDAAVAAAYGWPANLTDDAILERLLALNLERAGG